MADRYLIETARRQSGCFRSPALGVGSRFFALLGSAQQEQELNTTRPEAKLECGVQSPNAQQVQIEKHGSANPTNRTAARRSPAMGRAIKRGCDGIPRYVLNC
jgi:hypothetical protein